MFVVFFRYDYQFVVLIVSFVAHNSLFMMRYVLSYAVVNIFIVEYSMSSGSYKRCRAYTQQGNKQEQKQMLVFYFTEDFFYVFETEYKGYYQKDEV